MLGQEYPDVVYLGPPLGYRKDGDGDPVVTDKRWITIHNTSNTATARAEASWARRRPDKVSSHYYADPVEIVQTLNTAYCANHVGSDTGNLYGISYELTGTNDRSTLWWLQNLAWGQIAQQIARDCVKHKIPPVALTLAELEAGRHGIITHDMARLVWGKTTHTDPGRNFPMTHLESLVQRNIEEALLADPTIAQMVKDQWYAMFTNDAPNRPAGSISAKVDAIRVQTGQAVTAAQLAADAATRAAEAADAARAAAESAVGISDEQLERVIRKIARSVPE